MPVVLVANPKGGVGKSTLATQIAGYFASRGHAVMLGDTDRQQSSQLFLKLRPLDVAPIKSWETTADSTVVRPPRGTTHAVLDTPAGLHGKRLRHALGLAGAIVVPLQPSIFDIYATRDFVDRLAQQVDVNRVRIALVGTRVGGRTLAGERLREFIDELGMSMVAELRDAQVYVQLAASGLTLFDVAPARVQRDLDQWQPLCRWLDECATSTAPVPLAAPAA